MKNSIKLCVLFAYGINIINKTAKKVPTIINGVRLPNFVLILSENAPNRGNKNNARTLSRAIITPVNISSR
jgi:hypothetical protein